MKISFDNHRISAGPLNILQHIYYAPNHYGLSVRQTTGMHQDYWSKELPKLLKNAKDRSDLLNRLIKELEHLGARAEERRARQREQIHGGKWAEKEIVLNAELLAVLSALPDTLLGSFFTRLTGARDFPKRCRVVDLKLKKERDGEDTDFVEPDLLILGEDTLLMIEIKSRGGKTSSRSYPPLQLLNYMRLIIECRKTEDDKLPSRFGHLILMPSLDLKWLEQHEKWVMGIDKDNERKLRVNANASLVFGDTYVKKHRGEFYNTLKSTPIYYRSWDELADAFQQEIQAATKDPYHKHWERVGAELLEMANKAGMYKQ
ncbi:MAG: hypothetical protein WC515_00445 [Candidatus Omnitrophota bacterium]